MDRTRDQARPLRPDDERHRRFQAHRNLARLRERLDLHHSLTEGELFAAYGMPCRPGHHRPDCCFDREPESESELELRALYGDR